MTRPAAFVERALAAEKEFWRQTLADADPGAIPVDIAASSSDTPSPDMPSPGTPPTGTPSADAAAALVMFAFDARTTAKALAASKERDALVFTLLVAALKIVLHRYTGSTDLIVATGIHKRHADTADLNRLVLLRDRLDAGQSIRDVVAQVQKTIASAFEHQKYPVERLLASMADEDGGARASLFQVALLFDGIHDPHVLDDVRADIVLLVRRDGDDLRGEARYDARRFQPETIARLAEDIDRALACVLTTSDEPLASVRLTRTTSTADAADATPRAGAIRSSPIGSDPIGSDTDVRESEALRDEPVHEAVRRAARRVPNVLAVAGAEPCSYEYLDRRSNQFARWLTRAGAGRGTRVATCFDHSADGVIAVLAVLKAGAAYVPIDVLQPVARMALVLEDARPALVLAHERTASALPEGLGSLHLLESLRAEIDVEDAGDLPCAAGSSDAAYIIYTSGSTGRPKGVQIPHGALTHYIRWAADLYLRGETGRAIALFSSMAFDLTVTSVFMPLVTGNTIVPYSRMLRESAVLKIVEDDGVDVLKLTPSHLALLKDGRYPRARLRTLIVGGEALDVALAARIQEAFDGCVDIFNEYGPTETTVGCIVHRFDPDRDRRACVPIGRPAARTHAYVLDDRHRPVETHAAGDLFVGGAGVGDGYAGNAALTADRFIPDPAGHGARMYRTGDLARILPDGRLEFIGRRDGQIKFHGHRIELDELRLALNRHRDVRDSVVMVKKDRHGIERLVAYYASRQELRAPELIAVMLERVPREIVPHVYVHVKRLPLTIGAKIDFAALPPIPEPTYASAEASEAPRTAVEELLAGIWADVLGRDRVGSREHFFELGGHSLLATQVVARIREVLRVDVPVRLLFEAPTVERLAAQIARLPQGGAIASADAASAAADGIIPRAPRDVEPPLSFEQQRLWVLDQLQPGQPLYNVPLAVRLRGAIEPGPLAEALSAIVRRHEALRTRFVSRDGQAVQIVEAPWTVPVPVTDWRQEDASTRSARLAALQRDEAAAPFDLTSGRLLRAQLVRLDDDACVLLLTLHHIVSDWWSLGVLIKELSALYAGAVRSEAVSLPALPIQYADYASWQRGADVAPVLDEQLTSWRTQLADAPVLALPTDSPRPATEDTAGACERRSIDSASLARLHAVCRREGVTLHMLLLAAFALVLSRWTQQRDIVIGTAVAGRTRPELLGLIGFFVNTLPLRVSVTSSARVRELWASVREVCLSAYAHQAVPFERVIDALGVARDASRPPLVQAMLNVQAAGASGTAAGASIGMEPVEDDGSAPAKFEVTLNAGERPDGLMLRLEYRKALFGPARMQRLLIDVERVLDAMTAAPDERVSALPWLDASEEASLLAWSTGPRTRVDGSVLADIVAQAARRPDAVAVVCGDEAVTYRLLIDRATVLARVLRTHGIGPESRVGVCLERSIAQIVSVLAVWQAGGAYVPLDPAHPSVRKVSTIADARLAAVLTSQDLSTRLPQDAAAPVLIVDAMMRAARDERASMVLASNDPRALAYIIYTSGSTGTPKGVAVTHGGVRHLVAGQVPAFGAMPGLRVLQYASMGFDASVSEICTTLASGATLELVADEQWRAGDGLADMVRTRGIAVVTLPPSVLRGLDPARVPGVTTVVSAGEACSAELASRWRGGRRFINAYGPTEISVCATLACVGDESGDPPIGRPLPNAQAYVLDADAALVPAGVAGELYVGGAGVARGYIGQPALTASRFVPDPFGGEPGARLYRTGDRCRWRADGALAYIGRTDAQVKLRGQRIEPGEIESVLRQHDAVQDAVALVREDVPDQRQLVAYVVPRARIASDAVGASASGAFAECGVDAATLQAFLRGRLPAFMMPSAVLFLGALPLTPHGKIDRAALPAPERDAAGADAEPRTPAEILLAEIWAAVLGRDRVGIHENFFELGGDSILTLQVVSRARQEGLRISARQIFELPTIALLAAAGEDDDQTSDQGLVSGPVALTPIQHWFFAQAFAAAGHWNQAMLLRVAASVEAAGVHAAVSAILSHHDALRMRYEPGPEGWRQVNLEDEPSPWWQELTVATADEIPAVATAIQASLDLVTGPVQRVAFIRVGDGSARLLWVIHHLIVDGVSWRVLLEDLANGYVHWTQGEPIQLPAKSASLQQWAAALSMYGTSEDLRARELEYWIAQAGTNAAIPVDDPPGANTTASAERVGAALSAAETSALMREATGALRATVEELLLAAAAHAYGDWTAQPELIVALEGHGRDETRVGVEVARTIGWFATLYPVRLPAQGPDAAAILADVKRAMRAVPDRGIGYGLLRYVARAPELADAIAPDVSFNYLGQWDTVLAPDAPHFTWTAESSGPVSSPRNHRPYVLELSAGIADHLVQVRCTYSRHRHRRETIDDLMRRWLEALRALIAAAADPDRATYEPEDFPLTALTGDELDSIAALVDDGALADGR